MQELWSNGVEDTEKQTDILTQLNRHLAIDYRCACGATVWQPTFQVSVDTVEPTE